MFLLRILRRILRTIENLFDWSYSMPNEAKRYGMRGEDVFCSQLRHYLPGAMVKQNIRIETQGSRAEIDCLLLYQDKLFAIEVKSWKGETIEKEDCFVQRKVDEWTGEIHEKRHRSPFLQLARAIHLLRKQIPGYVWVNGIVYFKGAARVTASEDMPWFLEMNELADYIRHGGRASQKSEAVAFFGRCVDSHDDRWRG